MKVCLLRAPALPKYHDIDIKEDPMLTALLGYFDSINLGKEFYDIFDFQLEKDIAYKDLLKKTYDHYVIAARDVGESYRYSVRIATLLSQDTNAKIWLYGQVSPLRSIKKLPERVAIVNQSEQELAHNLGIETSGAHFTKNLNYLTYYPYIKLEKWQETRRKGVIETSRGCPYHCKFCFINVGQSYEKRWQIRPNESIIQDIKQYLDMGINQFVFLDSEFLGANPRQHRQRKILLEQIIAQFPPIKYMILCRADTLLAFNEFDLLKKSGLSKVLVGVESLYQNDLDLLRKDTTVEKLKTSIKNLIDREIECCLTFLTFHRYTTIQGLRQNLAEVEELYQHPKIRYLGMPNFSFNMEVKRDGGEGEIQMHELSNITYLSSLLEARGQVESDKACFPTNLEPLIETYRILQYEWVVKKCELIRAKLSCSNEDKEKINLWFNKLGLFCVKNMRYFLNEYDAGNLTFTNLKQKCEELFNNYKEFYQLLPANLQELATYDHFLGLNYRDEVAMVDHGWDEIIPLPTKLDCLSVLEERSCT